ncbi:UDP-N-acetylglucosamine 4,6-dehydratase family protein, partial [Thermobrachium celere]|uniref:UDP-N-acetylglucosamine 4,6-dehydratase family protein n=1 Tax=Thermobrachium celere TaxID=53422 RepID=UPI0019410543
KSTGCEVKIMPSMDEVLTNTERVREIRDVKIEDLLKRDPIKLDNNAIKEYIENKVVLVTGGGGSIGSELCRQVIRFNPKKLLILDIYENNAYDLELELRANYPHIDIEVLIASIRDKKRMETIFEKYRPYVVFHAAAHKHVPLMENNPSEAVKNNIFGTLNLVECADKYNVKRFVLISTDKAVNPTNVMGATKRAAEMIVQAYAKRSKTEFVAVRFGNVLGSNGSVIPLFKKQIEKGGPVTVTHREITRYFMTIPEACQLVLQSAAYAKGGEIFVLDMGEPVKIYDMACNLIRLSGFEPEKDIKIKITGLRPGEKLYEELLLAEEGLTKTQNSKIYVAKPLDIDYEELKLKLEALKFAIQSEEPMKIKNQLKEIVDTYQVYDEVAAGEE